MNAAKGKAIDLIRSLPEDCTLEEIQYHLYVYEKIRRGIGDVGAGRVVPQEEAEQRVNAGIMHGSRRCLHPRPIGHHT